MGYTLNRQYQKSVLDTYTLTDTAVAINGLLPLEQNSVLTGCSIKHPAGSTSIEITKPGLYLVNFNAEGSTAAASGNMTAQLFRNGVSVPGATASAASSAAADIESISFSKVILVRPSCCAVDNRTTLTFVNTGVAALYTTVNVNVIKLC